MCFSASASALRFWARYQLVGRREGREGKEEEEEEQTHKRGNYATKVSWERGGRKGEEGRETERPCCVDTKNKKVF